MSSENTNADFDLDPNDPLCAPVNTLKEPEYPVLREGTYRMIVRGVEGKVSENNGRKSRRAEFKLATTSGQTLDNTPALDAGGRPIGAGFGVTASVFLTPGENETAEDVARKAAMPIKAILGKSATCSIIEVIRNPSLVTDKVVDVKIGIRPGKGEYGPQNVVKSWLLPRD